MATITVNRSDVRNALFAESTNAGRNFRRSDGVSEFEDIVIDEQIDNSLDGAWREATSKLSEKMFEFLTGAVLANDSAQYVFAATTQPVGLSDNIKQYIVNYMMQDWLASVRPDYRQRYIDRANFEMDDLLRKLYKKNPPSYS